MIPLYYYLKEADVRRLYFIFINIKIGDELYSFKFPATFPHRKRVGLKVHNPYHDTYLNQAHHL